MLGSIFNSHRLIFEKIAESWISEGASFSVWVDGQRVGNWHSEQVDTAKAVTLTTSISEGQTNLGSLSVSGNLDEQDEKRLNFQALLIAELAQSEIELNGLAIELIDVRDRFLALNDLVKKGWTEFDIHETANRIARETCRLVMAEGAFLFIEFLDQNPITYHYPVPLLRTQMIRDYVKQMAQTSTPKVFDFPRLGGESNNRFHDILLVPLQVHRAKKAVLGLVNKIDGQFKTPDMKLAETIGAYAAVQIDNTLLYEDQLKQTRLQTEMELARRIQTRLLPQELPSVAGIELCAISRPALQIGGDFYDFYMRSDGEMVFTVGDISGKGLSAAMLMAIMRTTIRSKLSISYLPSLASVLEQTNLDLYDDFSNLNMFATVFMGQYSPVERRLSYANAGHSPVILCPANGRARLLTADSLPLCILETNAALTKHIELNPGDIMLVGTDGLNEARNRDNEMLGYEHLLNFVEANNEQTANHIAQSLIDEIDTFSSGKNQEDDETIVILKIKDA